MPIPVARLEQLSSNKTIKEFARHPRCARSARTTIRPRSTEAPTESRLTSGPTPHRPAQTPPRAAAWTEPTTNVKLTAPANRDANWPTARKPGIRQVTMEVKATSLQSNTINWLDERTVSLPAVETMRRHQSQLIREDVDSDLYNELVDSIPAGKTLTNGELGVANGPKWDVSDKNFIQDGTNTLTLFGKAIDNFFDQYVEEMDKIGALNGSGEDAGELYAHMHMRTWHLYQLYLEAKNIIPDQQRAMLSQDRYLGDGMAVMIRKGIKILTNSLVSLPSKAAGGNIVIAHERSAVQVGDIPGVTSIFSPRTNPTGPHWRINQAAALAVKKVDPRTVYAMFASGQA